MASFRDLTLARRARRAGARYGLRIIWEARRAGIPISLAFALVEQESGFRNITGADAGAPCPHMRVTPSVVQRILSSPVSNGVGLTQLTYKPYIRQAQAMGGAHVPRYQLRVGFRALASLIRANGRHAGIRAYNGSGPAAERYAVVVQRRADRWHKILDP